MSDRAAITYVIQDSVGEVQLCRLALEKASNVAVKSFCSQMISDHTKMMAMAQSLGKQVGVDDTAAKPTDESQIELAHLNRYSGNDFDEEFMKAQINDHRNDIETLRDARESSQDAQVQSWIDGGLTQLVQHLNQADDVLNIVERSQK